MKMEAQAQSILQAAESLLPEMLAELQTLVEIESPTSDREAVNRVGAHLKRELESLAFQVEILPGGQRGDHLKANWGRGAEQVLVLSHMDTVWPLGTLVQQPYRREGDYIFGPGTADMKGGIVVALGAITILQQLDMIPPHRIVVLLTSDEEFGSITSRRIIEQEARASRYVLVTEPGDLPDGKVKTQRKGTGMFDITIHGVQSHAGAAHQDGANAISELARQILKLDALTDYQQGTTINVGSIQGGRARNVVAGEATAKVDLRVTTSEEAKRLEKIILALEPEDERTSIEVTGGVSRPPMPRSREITLMYERARACAEQLGFELPETASGGGSDGNFTAAFDIPTLDGLGAVGAGIHATDERIQVSWLPKRAALFAILLTLPKAELRPNAKMEQDAND